MKTMLKYDFVYLKKTSKLVILLVVALMLAAMSALTARYLNIILEFALAQDNIDIIGMPESTVMDSYVQFFSNFTQLYLFVVLFVSVAFFTHDYSKGHYPIIFTKPIKRSTFIYSKSIVISLATLTVLILASMFFGYYTWLLFGSFDVLDFLVASFVYYIFLMIIIHIALLFSSLFQQYMLSLVFTIVVFFTMSLISIVEFNMTKILPTHLGKAPMMIMMGEYTVIQNILTIMIGLATVIVLLILSIHFFKKKALV